MGMHVVHIVRCALQIIGIHVIGHLSFRSTHRCACVRVYIVRYTIIGLYVIGHLSLRSALCTSYVCACVRICVYICVCMQRAPIYLCTYTQYTRAYTQTNTHTCIQTYITTTTPPPQTHKYTQKHTHTSMNFNLRSNLAATNKCLIAKKIKMK